MLVVWGLLTPLLLAALLLLMERLEMRVALGGVREGLRPLLLAGVPEDVEEYVAKGFGPAVEEHWRRQRAPRRAA